MICNVAFANVCFIFQIRIDKSIEIVKKKFKKKSTKYNFSVVYYYLCSVLIKGSGNKPIFHEQTIEKHSTEHSLLVFNINQFFAHAL